MNGMSFGIKEVLKMIKENQITSEEGLEIIKELKRRQAETLAAVEKPASFQAGRAEESGEIPFKAAKGADGPDMESVKAKLLDIMSTIIHIPVEEIDINLSFKDMGVDSISGVEIVRDVNKAFGLNLDAVVLYDFANVTELSMHIAGQSRNSGKTDTEEVERALEKPKSQAQSVKNEAERYQQELLLKNLPSYGADKAGSEYKEMPAEQSKPENVQRNTMGAKPLKIMQTVQKAPIVEEKGKTVLKAKDSFTAPMAALEVPSKEGGASGKVALKPLGQELVVKPAPAQGKMEAPAPMEKKVYIRREESASLLEKTSGKAMDIAVIGMSCRYAQADTIGEFWENIVNCRDCIVEVPKDRWDIDRCYDPDPRAPNKTYSRWMGTVNNVDKFDPLFFNISPLEAELMDPQQRLFLQEAWNAFEGAGYSDRSLDGVRCGVYVGSAYGDYEKYLNFNTIRDTGESFAGLSTSILPARISYLLNLKGPSVSIDTACSSSLIAIHEACQSILCGESDMAIAGGVRLMLTPSLHIQTCKAGMLSPTGTCKTFDNSADGIVLGEGVGVILLKPLDKALADNDHIYGVIKGSGSNQDGKTNGISAPSAQAQVKLEVDVYRRFGIDPETITLIEAHGTGTKLGDPIEVKALKESFGQFTSKRNYCALGSVKANIGHTTLAAGVAGIIKVLLAFQHKKIPGLVNFKNRNEHISIEDSPFYIPTETKDWITPGNMPRRAAVSSFGFSGTNCHIVLEEAPLIDRLG